MIETYECDRCGACCKHMGIPVTERDTARNARISLLMTPKKTELGIGFLGDPNKNGCPLLENNECSVYEDRPDCCKVLEAGSPLCQWSRGRGGLMPLAPKEMTSKRDLPTVVIALPSRPGENISLNIWLATQPGMMGSGFHLLDIWAQYCSLLNNNFNDLWAAAINYRKYQCDGIAAQEKGLPRTANPVKDEKYKPAWDKGWDYAAGLSDVGPISHFVMIHSDVGPEPGRWIQDLLEEQKRVGADILSCVIALKDLRGLSSTGMMLWNQRKIKKFSVRQCLSFGRSFDAAAAGYPGECLLLNSGLWICDLTQPWARKMCFRSYDTIIDDPDTGEMRAVSTGEDWLFSMDAYRLGLKTWATNALTVKHTGTYGYPNKPDWGTHENEDEWGEPWCVQQPPSWGFDEGPAINTIRSTNTPAYLTTELAKV